jgi:hypothetical protein
MRKTIDFMAAALLVLLMSAPSATAQTTPEIWRDFAERLTAGTELNIGLSDGRRFRATLLGVRHDAVLLQPKTRVAVPIQAVPFEAIVRMEPRKAGIGAGKAVAIGVATGVGAFFGILALMFAAAGD